MEMGPIAHFPALHKDKKMHFLSFSLLLWLVRPLVETDPPLHCQILHEILFLGFEPWLFIYTIKQ